MISNINLKSCIYHEFDFLTHIHSLMYLHLEEVSRRQTNKLYHICVIKCFNSKKYRILAEKSLILTAISNIIQPKRRYKSKFLQINIYLGM